MRQVSRLRIRALLLLCAAWLLLGCSPEFDWRELNPPEGHFKALMPARPSAASGADAAGHAQSMWGAEARSTLFSIGYTDYGDAAQLHMSAVRDALVQSARGKLVREADTQPPQPKGLSFTIQGQAGDGSDRILQVWLFPRGTRLYQLAIAGKPDSVSAADADFFVSSFKLD